MPAGTSSRCVAELWLSPWSEALRSSARAHPYPVYGHHQEPRLGWASALALRRDPPRHKEWPPTHIYFTRVTIAQIIWCEVPT